MPDSRAARTHASAASSSTWPPWVIQFPTRSPRRPCRCCRGDDVPSCERTHDLPRFTPSPWSRSYAPRSGPEPTSEDLHPSEEGPYRQRLRVGRTLSIPLDEVEWRATTSGGRAASTPNRASSRVEVRFDVWRRRASARANGPACWSASDRSSGPAPVRTAHRPEPPGRARPTDHPAGRRPEEPSRSGGRPPRPGDRRNADSPTRGRGPRRSGPGGDRDPTTDAPAQSPALAPPADSLRVRAALRGPDPTGGRGTG